MDEAIDRRNGNLYLWANLANYLAAPVFFVDVTQAALCNKLGASAMVANLPASLNMLGFFAPIAFACLVPHSWERRMAFAPRVLIAVFVAVVGLALIVPLSNQMRIAAVIGESLILGILNSITQVFMLQCLGRGTSQWGRARALKLTFSFGPIAAVAGALGSQWILRGGIPGLIFPRDFALLHLLAAPCAAFTAWCFYRFELESMAEEGRSAFFSQLRDSFLNYTRSRQMAALFLAYLLLNCGFYEMGNLSLYTKQALGRQPAEFAGIILAIRFGSKALAGFALGVLNIRFGLRAPLIVTVTMIGLAMIWAWVVPGYYYLAVFGFMGAAELGGVYFPNAVLSLSPALTATRDLSILSLTIPASSPCPALFGFVADHWGFPVSFALGTAAALGALWLVLRLPAGEHLPSPAGGHTF